MKLMIYHWEIEREDTLTAKVQKLNQKFHCKARGRHAACSSRAIATRRRRHTVSKNHFVPLLTLLVCLFLRHRGCALRQKRFQRSCENHERFAELEIVHNQVPTRHRLPPHHRRWGRCRCCRRRRRAGPGAAGAAVAAGKNK